MFYQFSITNLNNNASYMACSKNYYAEHKFSNSFTIFDLVLSIDGGWN